MAQKKSYFAVAFALILILVSYPIEPNRKGSTDFKAPLTNAADVSPPTTSYRNFQDLPMNGSSVYYDRSIPSEVSAEGEGTIEDGILNPTTVEETGYVSPGVLSGRTDTGTGTSFAIPLDEEHGWVASRAEVDVWNLTRLYAVNGSFVDGIPGPNVNPNGSVEYHPFGWDAISNDTSAEDGQTQIATYDDSGTKYVIVENQGEKTGSSGKRYVHTAGTYVLWNQSIDNPQQETNFVLSFKYLYLRGPLGDPPGNCSIKVYVNDTVISSISLPDLEERGTWYDTGGIPVNLSSPGEQFQFKIGLFIDETLDIRSEDNWTGGIDNTAYITAFLDDVSLVGKDPPAFSEVQMEYHANSSSQSILGSDGEGSGEIVFDNHIETGPVNVEITSNTSVSFLYKPRMLSHHFGNSSWTTDFDEKGVSYSVTADRNSNLTLYTYLGTKEDYENFSLAIHHPMDWMDARVYDPFLVEVSDQCIDQNGRLEIPESVLNRLGWWLITFESPNYAESLSAQIWNETEAEWSNTTSYATGNLTRAIASLGGEYPVDSSLGNVQFRWIMPNGTIWHNTTIDSYNPSSVLSQELKLAGFNTTAGQWMIEFFWSNGTELALSCVSFVIRHELSIEPIESHIETEVGETITVLVRLQDLDNGYLIMSGPTVINMKWAESTVEFAPNILRNWWEASLDTSLQPAGTYLLNVSVSSPHFWNVTCTIELQSVFSTSLTPPEGPIEPLIFGRAYSFAFAYSLQLNTSNVKGANVSISQSGTGDYEIEETLENFYNLTVVPGNLGNQSLTLTFNKEGCESQHYVFTYLVVRVPIEVSIESSLVGVEGSSLDLEIRVSESDTGDPVTNASVVYGIFPSVGDPLTTGIAEEASPGLYVATIAVPTSTSGGLRLRVQVEKTNFETIDDFSAELVSLIDQQARMVYYAARIGGILAILIIAGGVYTVYRRKKKSEYREALAIKRRFDDANDLIGIIVLHKSSGLPVYSRILKGGFDESVISAFITAITHFRSEFDAESMDARWKVLPISDIIRAVETENLICAFITVSKPSEDQEDRMKEFSVAVGDALDNQYEDKPSKVGDESITNLIDTLFYSTLDGHLLKYYKRGTSEEFPRKYRCLDEVLEETESHCAKPSYLAKSLSKCGVNEPRASKLVLEAINKDFLVSCQPNEANNHSFALDWEL